MTTLHYIFDPLCGWCYAAEPLVEAAREVSGLSVKFHGGGMLAGSNRRPVSPTWREHVTPHDLRIAELTGQPFGTAYFDGLLYDTGAIMDSEPPTAAILAADALGGRGLDVIGRLQRAHYVEGRRIADAGVLVELATELGIDGEKFRETFSQLLGDETFKHVAVSRNLLAKVGGQGFPTFALEHDDGRFTKLDIRAWLGRPESWKEHLASFIPASIPSAEGAEGGPVCGPDHCEV